MPDAIFDVTAQPVRAKWKTLSINAFCDIGEWLGL